MSPSTTPGWLFLHGVPLSPAVWGPLVQRLSADPGVEVIAPHLVASKNSPTVQAELAQTLIKTRRKDARRLHVVGHSFGGQVALEFALGAPELVASLTLVCTRDTPFPTFAQLADTVRAAPIDASTSVARWFSSPELAADGPAVRYARKMLAGADRSQWADALTAIAGFDCSARTGEITAPTTVVAAELDRVSTVAAMSEMAERITGARLTVLPDAAHMSPFSDPVRLTEIVQGSAQRA